MSRLASASTASASVSIRNPSAVRAIMNSNMILPWGWWPDRDIANYAGSLHEPAPVKLPQDGGA